MELGFLHRVGRGPQEARIVEGAQVTQSSFGTGLGFGLCPLVPV